MSGKIIIKYRNSIEPVILYVNVPRIIIALCVTNENNRIVMETLICSQTITSDRNNLIIQIINRKVEEEEFK